MKRMLTSIASMAIVVGGWALVAPPAGAAGTYTPTITVTPNIGLTNGETVMIAGSGFSPSEASLVAVECNLEATSEAGCNTTSIAPVTIDASGNLASTSFVVATGTIGNGTCGTSAADSTCIISIGSTATSAVVAYASIAFATGPGVSVTPSTGLANGATVSITGSGFTPADSLYAVECLETATTEGGCDISTVMPITASATGTLPATTFKVAAGTVGTGSCGSSAANYDSCIIEVATMAGTDRGIATIDFATPKVTTPPAPVATKVTGFAYPGRTVTATVTGKNFTAVSKVTGGPGSVIRVTSVSSSHIKLKISESTAARAGTFPMTIHFKSGKAAKTRYTVK